MENKTIIFTDGSSRGNPGPGGWGVIINDESVVTELGGREKMTTNNRMELLSAINALTHVKKNKKEIILNTDSSYLINGITKWIYIWQKKNWKNSSKEDVVNRDLWERLIEASKNLTIKWNYVGGHSGVPGNERCDEIATSFADGHRMKLYLGKKTDYKINLANTTPLGIKRVSSGSKNKKIKAYSYLSLVEGVLKKHKTWAECEQRVKGVKGIVKYKKAIDEENERQIMAEWGYN